MTKSPTFAQFGQGTQTLNLPNLPFWQKILALPAYHWLLLAVLSVAIPHLAGVPAWLSVLLVVSIIMQKPAIKAWVARLTKGHLKRSYQVLQLLVFVGGALSIWVGFGQAFGVDVAVSFLTLCFISKLWELYQKRDAYVVLNLGLFVLGSAFLIRQNLSVALAGLPSLLAILMAFVVISDDDNTEGAGRLRTLGMLTLPAVPLLVVLFVFFPRLPPMWSLPMAGKSATTGMSDTLSPGDFSHLSQSSELAFRVEFDDAPPARHQMYWRGLVMSDFDGKTWRQHEFSPVFWSSRDGQTPPDWAKSAYVGTANSYQVILEPTEQHWLFALDYPKLHPQRGIDMSGEFTLRSFFPISQQLRYRSSYYADGKVDLTLTDVQKRINLRLPQTGNTQSRALAQTLFAQADSDPVRYVQAVQRFIGSQGFSYTLSPPPLQENRIDEFLFGTKAGFCEHYASSFTFLMRSVGIPARVVAGYQGGELGRDGKSWEVRQMDAHAWSEVWLDGQGWVRIDPTSFVSPERIQNGMNALTQEAGAKMFGDGMVGQWSYQQFKLLQTLRRYSDQASYYWQRDVVGYDQDKQRESLFKWFNIQTFAEQFWVLVGGVVGLVFVFVLFNLYRRKKRYHALDLPLVLLSNKLAKMDKSLAKNPSEPYLAWLDRINGVLNKPDEIDELKKTYRRYRYGDELTNPQIINQVKILIKKLSKL